VPEINLLLGASLRRLHPEGKAEHFPFEVDGPLTVRELLDRLGLAVEQARVVLINHRKAFLDSRIDPGDRVGIFPPELAFNMYVALEMAHHGLDEDEARQGIP